VPAATGLNTGFLIGGDDPFIVFQWLAFPDALIQIQNAARLAGEVRITGEDPDRKSVV
jgi:hypothetical protein